MDAFTLDPRQLVRIEAVHGGFLYQHVYAAACLFQAAAAGLTHVVVENDEDVELVRPDERIYAQVKKRSANLVFSDIEGALNRFDAIRVEHAEGHRDGICRFAIVSNSAPGPELAKRIRAKDWPSDVVIAHPEYDLKDDVLPQPCASIELAFEACQKAAENLPFGVLAPETLVWKLAGRIMAASAGAEPTTNHAFAVADLPTLFEQLVIQLQDFPAPPLHYRPQDNEPSLLSDHRVRLIVGFSGAGKTSWVSQAALHSTDHLAYYDVADVSGPALSSAVARELAARIFGSRGGKLGEILLPGASGTEILFAIGRQLAEDQLTATIVLDNAHRVPAEDLASLVAASEQLKFILLAQPGQSITRIEATTGIKAEPLSGWSNETAVAEGASIGCSGNYEDYERLLSLTGGLPLYVQNAVKIANEVYEGDLRRFIEAFAERTHLVETAQELILTEVFDTFNETERQATAVLSLSDVPLTQAEATGLLNRVFGIESAAAAAAFRRLRSSGAIQIFGIDRLKVHDAVRPLGRASLEISGDDYTRKGQEAICDLLVATLHKDNDRQRVFMLLRMFVALGNIKPLVEMAADEMFHELGYMSEIADYLEAAADADSVNAEDRFWALDGLVFAHLKVGDEAQIEDKLRRMEVLVREERLGPQEQLAFGMKRMVFAARAQNAAEVKSIMRDLTRVLPKTPQHLRVARYNYAHAMYELGQMDECTAATLDLVSEYYDVIGLTIGDVMAKNPDEIFPELKQGKDHTDDLKHLADALDLQSKAIRAMGGVPGLGPIHAMKFYSMAQALDSFIRVGQELVDDFIGRSDYIGARDVIERNLMPTIVGLKLAGRVIPVRSQYAVVLAYCGAFEEADAEITRLLPYKSGLDERGQIELENQRSLIAYIRENPPPPQWEMPPQLTGSTE
ncbi:MAG: ATP-binding protein [Cyanobacteria bacterium P01_E01_bin.48]